MGIIFALVFLIIVILLIVNAAQVGSAYQASKSVRGTTSPYRIKNRPACPACLGDGFQMQEVVTTVWQKEREKKRGARITYSEPRQEMRLKRVSCQSCCGTGYAVGPAETIGRA